MAGGGCGYAAKSCDQIGWPGANSDIHTFFNRGSLNLLECQGLMEDRVGSPENDIKLNGTQNSKKGSRIELSGSEGF